tara:strand:- start:2030 stop:2416 length:387 start_codon:yes stop_codon:yes gene_type:complete
LNTKIIKKTINRLVYIKKVGFRKVLDHHAHALTAFNAHCLEVKLLDMPLKRVHEGRCNPSTGHSMGVTCLTGAWLNRFFQTGWMKDWDHPEGYIGLSTGLSCSSRRHRSSITPRRHDRLSPPLFLKSL